MQHWHEVVWDVAQELHGQMDRGRLNPGEPDSTRKFPHQAPFEVLLHQGETSEQPGIRYDGKKGADHAIA
jgi:hypothetical protein